MSENDLINAYLRVLEKSIIYTRTLAYESLGPIYKHSSNQKKMAKLENILDVIHVIPKSIVDWQSCDKKALRKYLEKYDEKWANKKTFSMINILDNNGWGWAE